MKNILIIFSVLLFSCKGTSQENLESNTIEKKESKNIFNRVETISSLQDNSLFTFQDNSSLFIEQFDSNQYIKLSNKMIFLSKSFLESAETFCYLYSYKDEKVLILEGNDYYAGVFYVYYFEKNNLYEIGTFGLRYPNIEDDRKSEEVNFKVENESNKVLIQIFKNNKFLKNEVFIISDKEKLKKFENENDFINYLMQKNLSTPENLINYLVFTRDKNDSLQINTEILDFISKTTTRENSNYLFALEDYGYKYRNSEIWSIDEFAKIKAYIFNTTYPLRKKYWSDKFNEWYGGNPNNFLGAESIWRDNDYYGLPNLDGYVYDFRHWGEPL